MLNTEKVVNLLKDIKTMSFDDIWKKVKDDYESDNESKTKADLYMSMIEEPKLLMVGDNDWALVANYTIEQRIKIDTDILGAELLKEEE